MKEKCPRNGLATVRGRTDLILAAGGRLSVDCAFPSSTAQVRCADVPVKDEPGYFVPVPEWIVLAGLTPQALALYTVLLGHVNRERGDNLAWPSMDLLADVLGFGKRQSVIRYLKELADRGIIEVETTKCATGRRNNYTVHRDPPADYSGARSFTEFHHARRAAQGGLSPTGDYGSSATEDNGSSPTGDKNQTKSTRRSECYESTSGDEATSTRSRTSSSTGKEDQNREPKILILLGSDFGELTDGEVIQYLVGASVSGARRVHFELPDDFKTELGREVKRHVEMGTDRYRLAEELQKVLNAAMEGRHGWSWAFDDPWAA